MPIAATCGSCGKSYQVNDNMAGQQARCGCGGVINIPAAAAQQPMQQQPIQQTPLQQPMQQTPMQPAYGGGMVQPGGMGGGFGYAQPGRRVSANDILKIVFGILALAHGGLYGWRHGDIFFPYLKHLDNISINSGWDFMGFLLFLLHIFAFLLTLAVVGAGICLLIDGIARMSGTTLRMQWGPKLAFSLGAVYMGLAFLVLIIEVALKIKYKYISWPSGQTWGIMKAFLWFIFGLAVPICFTVLFFRRHKR